MPINYAEAFERNLEQQYARELTSADFDSNKKYKFINAKTVNVPTLTLSGYKDHARDGSKNRGSLSNIFTPYALSFDRDIEFFVDEADVDETNQALSAANITATFNEEQAIPETDAYRYSKLFADFVAAGGTAVTTALSVENILGLIDAEVEKMDEAGVPLEGRKMKVTPEVDRLIKQAKEISRYMNVNANSGNIDRRVKMLDSIEIKVVPSARMMTAYDFTEGFTPAVGAKQINFILYHNSAIIAPKKIADIYLWTKGSSPESAFGHLYQNRSYQDCFLIVQKKAGVAFHTAA